MNINKVLREMRAATHDPETDPFSVWADAIEAEIERLRRVRMAATRYLAHSDSGKYRDSAGLRPGTSPAGEDLRAALAGKEGKT
jgi:hypothetical protein